MSDFGKNLGGEYVHQSPPEDDPVNNPAHYTSGQVECLDAIEAALSPDEFRGFLKGQIIKYVWRERLKGSGTQDLEKAEFYLRRELERRAKGTKP